MRKCPHEMEHCACTYSPGVLATASAPKADALARALTMMTAPQTSARVVPVPSTGTFDARYEMWRPGLPLPRSSYEHHAVQTGVAAPVIEPVVVEVVEPQPVEPTTNWDDVWYEVWRHEPFLGDQYVSLIHGRTAATTFAQSRPAGQHIIRALPDAG